jgi:hypothetical protein
LRSNRYKVLTREKAQMENDKISSRIAETKGERKQEGVEALISPTLGQNELFGTHT